MLQRPDREARRVERRLDRRYRRANDWREREARHFDPVGVRRKVLVECVRVDRDHEHFV
jgi:hypothetical protein